MRWFKKFFNKEQRHKWYLATANKQEKPSSEETKLDQIFQNLLSLYKTNKWQINKILEKIKEKQSTIEKKQEVTFLIQIYNIIRICKQIFS